ncbi:hypothetical protein FRC04_010782 [Tulasnella sp. 424]|nr:hypothetical protein FRC04_010782 [Tulasnella sp. 424]
MSGHGRAPYSRHGGLVGKLTRTSAKVLTDCVPFHDQKGDGAVLVALVRGQHPGLVDLLDSLVSGGHITSHPTLLDLKYIIPDCWILDPVRRPSSSDILNRIILPDGFEALDIATASLRIPGTSADDALPPTSPLPFIMSSNADPPPTDDSSFTRGYSAMPRGNLFDAFPNELIVYILSFLPLFDIVRFGSTSRRHKSIASDEQIWLPVALNVIKDNVDPNDTLVDEEFMKRNRNRFLVALRLEVTETTTEAWYKIATKLLERVEWALGWWLEMAAGFGKGRIWRISIVIDERDSTDGDQGHHFFRAVATPVQVIEDRTSVPPLNDPLEVVFQPGGSSTLQLLDGDDLDLEGFLPLARRLTGLEALSGDLVFDDDDPPADESTSYFIEKLADHLAHLPEYGQTRIVRRRWGSSFADAPYPPPLLSQLLSHRGRQGGLEQPQIPSIGLVLETGSGVPEANFLSIRRPSSFPKVPNQLIYNGIYVAPYGEHGWEYLLIRVRELTEEDFRSTWPWEGSLAVAPDDVTCTTTQPDWKNPYHHLGPFSGIRPTKPFGETPVRVSRDHVRPGSRILEGIKITGDPNVPGGQRSFIAFLNDPLVGQDALQEAEETFPEVAPHRGNELPWPFVSQPPPTPEIVEECEESAYQQSFFAPERGIDIPGVMRIADTAFCHPQWTECVVHVEYKTKFTVAWSGGSGFVFRKLEDWTCTA